MLKREKKKKKNGYYSVFFSLLEGSVLQYKPPLQKILM